MFVIFFLNEPGLLGDIGSVKQQHAIRAETVTPGPAGFLIITLKIFWEILVDDKAYIRFVDAHTEGDGGANYLQVIANKGLLISAACGCVHARMIRGGIHAVFLEPRGQPFGAVAAVTIHDAALTVMFAYYLQHLPQGITPRRNTIQQVGPIETGDKPCGILQA